MREMQSEAAIVRYDSATIALHWTVAVLVAALWGLGQLTGAFGTSLNDIIVSTHIVLGFVLVAVVAVRIGWRVFAGRHLDEVGPPVMRVAAIAGHYLLYGLVTAVLLLGLLLVWARGDDIFGLFTLPKFDWLWPLGQNSKELARGIRSLHGLFANWLVILAGLHAAAGLFHHYFMRDGVLRRMLPLR